MIKKLFDILLSDTSLKILKIGAYASVTIGLATLSSTLYGHEKGRSNYVPAIQVPTMVRKVNQDAYAQRFNQTFHTDLSYSDITNKLSQSSLERKQ